MREGRGVGGGAITAYFAEAKEAPFMNVQAKNKLEEICTVQGSTGLKALGFF